MRGTGVERSSKINIMEDGIRTKGGGILSAGCGRGKTVMAINMITKIKLKTKSRLQRIALLLPQPIRPTAV